MTSTYTRKELAEFKARNAKLSRPMDKYWFNVSKRFGNLEMSLACRESGERLAEREQLIPA